MNIKQSNPLTNFYKPTGITNKTNSNTENRNNVSDITSEQSFRIKLFTEDTIAGGGAGTVSYDLKYAENSTDENPIIIATGWEDNGFGDEFNITININDIDPRNITAIELQALNSHIYAKYPEGTLIANSQFESLSSGNAVLDMGEGPTANMGLHDRFDYIASLESDLAHYKEHGNIPELATTTIKISNSLDAFLKFEKDYKEDKEKQAKSTYNPADDIAKSMVDQYSTSSQNKV